MKMIKVWILIVAGLMLSMTVIGNPNSQDQESNSFTLSGPYKHKNLEIYLVHGKQENDRNYMPLNEAMGKKVAIVDETGNVGQLIVKNTSGNQYVFINSGDIVKGGKQDRVVRFDILIPPQSKGIQISSFCVESGRWRKRGIESLQNFSGNRDMISSKRLRLSSKYVQSQGEVWASVASHQGKLSQNIGWFMNKNNTDVYNDKSSTSLQLTLESKDLEKIVNEYQDILIPVLKKSERNDVLGFVYSINGELNNGEIYNNYVLFQKLWEKLLKAAVTEAISEYDKNLAIKAVPRAEVEIMLTSVNNGKKRIMDINPATQIISYEQDKYIMFKSEDMQNDNRWVHQNFICKNEIDIKPGAMPALELPHRAGYPDNDKKPKIKQRQKLLPPTGNGQIENNIKSKDLRKMELLLRPGNKEAIQIRPEID